MEDDDTLFRQRSDSLNSFKRKKPNSPNSPECMEERENILKELRLMRSDISEVKVKLDNFSLMQDDIRKLFENINDLHGCLKSVDVKFERHDQKIEAVSQRIDVHRDETLAWKEDEKKKRHEVGAYFETKVKRNEKHIVEVQDEVWRCSDMVERMESEIQNKMAATDSKLIEIESRVKRNNLLFFGIPERKEENCFSVIKHLLRERCRIVKDIIIENTYRLGPYKDHKTRPILVILLDYNDKVLIKKARRDLPRGIFVSDDLPEEIRAAQNVLVPHLKEAKEERLDSFIKFPATLVVQGKPVLSVDPVTQEVKEIRPIPSTLRRNTARGIGRGEPSSIVRSDGRHEMRSVESQQCDDGNQRGDYMQRPGGRYLDGRGEGRRHHVDDRLVGGGTGRHHLGVDRSDERSPGRQWRGDGRTDGRGPDRQPRGGNLQDARGEGRQHVEDRPKQNDASAPVGRGRGRGRGALNRA